MLQIASEASGIPMDWIMIITGDTDICPYDPGAYASRQTYVAGTAVKKAAKACKDDVLRRVSLDMAIDIENLDIKDGWIINKGADTRLTSLGDFMKKVTYPVKNPAIICHEEFHYPTANMLTFGASFAHVEVEIKTGKVDVLKLITVLDAGRIINPTLAEGQLYGGTIMSIGFGTMEQILVDQKTGKVLNDNMLDYKIPTFADVPDIEAYFVETEEISSAYGNKSLGEPPNVSPASAICNAVLDAIGILVDELPLTPERVFRHIALDNAGKRSV
jgi:xanthine dehydrogenase molybdenum-binding subunit